MTIYVLRHAIAQDRDHWKGKDSERPLTSEGMKKMRQAAKGIRALKLGMDWILTSPYRRAADTADLVAKVLKAKKRVREESGLISEADPTALSRHLAQHYKPNDTLMLVGHEPFLSQLISMWIGSETALGLNFKKGGLCKLTAEKLRNGRCATLEWWLPPKVLRKLG